jgi:predicted porin
MAGAGQANAGARAGNLTYTGKFGDVTLLAEYDINDSGPTRQPSQQGTGRAIGAMYASGGVSLGGSYTAIESKAGVDAPITHVAVGGGYNFGDGSVKLGYSKKATKTAANDNTDTMMWLGGSFNVSNAVAVTAAYYSEAANTGAAGVADSTKKTARLGGTYALSKKTEFYLGLDRSVQNGGGAALDVVTVGTSAGLSTTF